MRVYDSAGAGLSFSVKTSTGMVEPVRRLGEIVKCARLDQRVFHQRLVETRDAKGDPAAGKQRSSNGLDSGELLRSPARNFKNVTGANRHIRQLTEINEALERGRNTFSMSTSQSAI